MGPPPGSEYEVIRYRDEHKPDVVELQKHLWSPRPEWNASYLEWKYERNPYLKRPWIYLVRRDGKIVGMRGMLGGRWEAGVPPETFPAICSEDLVIDPEHRNRGLMKKIMAAAFLDLADEGYDYVYSLSAGPVTLMGSLATGWRKVGSFRPLRLQSGRYERFQRIQRSVGGMRFFWRFAGRLPFRRLAKGRPSLHGLSENPPGSLRGSYPSIRVEQKPRPREMSKLVARLGYDGRIRHVRDEEYFSWRFRNPLHRYLFLYWEEERLEGYLVLQEYLSGLRSRTPVNIVDWEGAGPRIRDGLLNAALGLCPFPELTIWTATLGQDRMELLREAKFRPVPEQEGKGYEQPSLLVRAVRDGIPDVDWRLGSRRLLDIDGWDLRMIYSMNG